MQIAVLGIDLGKNSCSLVGLDRDGAVVKRRRMRPESIPAFTETLPAVHRRDGGLLWCASPRPSAGSTGSHRAPDVAGICSPLRQGAEER